MAELAIQARDLTKTFGGGVVAVNGLDLAVPPGAVYGLMGRNGAGKTTTLRLLMGLLRADRGEGRILGQDLWQAPRSDRSQIAYVSQTQQIHRWMTLAELCRYTAYFYDRWDEGYARDLGRRWGLNWTRPLGALSVGEQRRAAMLLAFACRPEVLLLDEPAAALDPISRREFLAELLDALCQRERCTVLISTHLIGDLERVAEFIGLMDRGRLVFSERLEELQRRYRRVQVVFPGAGVPPGYSVPGALREQAVGPVLTALVNLADDRQLDSLRAVPGVRLAVFPLNLEEVFIELLGRPDREEAPPAPEAEDPEYDNIIALK